MAGGTVAGGVVAAGVVGGGVACGDAVLGGVVAPDVGAGLADDGAEVAAGALLVLLVDPQLAPMVSNTTSTAARPPTHLRMFSPSRLSIERSTRAKVPLQARGAAVLMLAR